MSANKSQHRNGLFQSWHLYWSTWKTPLLQWGGAIGLGLFLGLFAVRVAMLREPQWSILITLALLLAFFAVILGDLRRLLLVVIVLNIPFAIEINPGFREDVSAIGSIGGLSISLTFLALLALFGLWILRYLTHQKQPRPNFARSAPVIAYLFFTVISIVGAQDVTLSFYEIFLIVKMVLLYLYITSTATNREDIIFILTVLLAGLLVEAILIIGIKFVGQTIPLGPISITYSEGGRPSGTLARANSAASYMSQALPVALALLLANARGWNKWLAVFSLGLGGIALVLTLSRGAWFAFSVASAIVMLGAWYRGWLSLKIPVALAAVFMVLLLSDGAVTNRLYDYDGGSAQGRVPLMQLAFRMIEDHPIFGVGANNFGVNIPDYSTPEFGGVWMYTVHNHYLLVWAEKGIGGFIAFIWFVLATLWYGVNAFWRGDRLLALFALGLTGAVMGHLVHMLVDFFNQRVLVQSLWLNAALIAAIYEAIKSEKLTTPSVIQSSSRQHLMDKNLYVRSTNGSQQ